MACSTSARVGVNASLQGSTWSGWMQSLPEKPMRRPFAAERRNLSMSRTWITTVSIGGSMPAMREPCVRRARA